MHLITTISLLVLAVLALCQAYEKVEYLNEAFYEQDEEMDFDVTRDESGGDDPDKPINHYDPNEYTVFWLTTKSSEKRKGTIVKYGNKESLTKAGFDASKPTRFIIHDWNTAADSDLVNMIKDAYLSADDCNVFVVDWDLGAFGPYVTVRRRSMRVARVIGLFIDFCAENGLKLSDTTLVGHGLGAHMAGMAGKKLTSGKLGVIFGLDPINLSPVITNTDNILASTDANYVEVMHTNIANSFIRRAMGHSDFYVNFGMVQPGCVGSVRNCSHRRACIYFAESIMTKRGFYGQPCRSIFEVTGSRSCRRDRRAPGLMGGLMARTNNTGVYVVPVGTKPPYALGLIALPH